MDIEVDAVFGGGTGQAFRNLFAFYRYDLMPFIEGGPGSCVNQYGAIDGETSKTHEEAFGDDGLFQKPGVISPFLIKADGELAGLAIVVTQPHATPGRDYRMEEFFVLNKFRRRGVGRTAASALLGQFRGRWEIAQRPTNHGAIAFWRSVVHEHTGGKLHHGTDRGTIPAKPVDPDRTLTIPLGHRQ